LKEVVEERQLERGLEPDGEDQADSTSIQR